MPQRWAIWLAIEGDLRFLSHHDVLRAVERVAVRAKLPLVYSQGFNPHPVLSLLMPRPVAVAAKDDLLVMSLDAVTNARQLLDSLNAQAPRGMHFFRAQPLEKKPPVPRSATYQLAVADVEAADSLQRRLAELQIMPQWQVQRIRPDQPPQQVDIRPLIKCIELENSVLKFILVPQRDIWARPSEVLKLLGLREREDLAELVRIEVDYGIAHAPQETVTPLPAAEPKM